MTDIRRRDGDCADICTRHIGRLVRERDEARAQVARVQAALNGALMVPQAEIRRALNGEFVTRWTEADPAPEQPWREASSPGLRRMALDACREAIRKTKDKTEGRQS